MTLVSPGKLCTCFHQSASARHQGGLSVADDETNTVRPGCNDLKTSKMWRVWEDRLLALNIEFADLGFVVRRELFLGAMEELAGVPGVAAPRGVVVPAYSPRFGCHRAVHVSI